eukprot:6410313-Ditylum_brightwellii.AAC.1
MQGSRRSMEEGQMDGPELREVKLDFLNKDDEVILNDTIREAEEKGEYEKRGTPDSGEMAQQEEEGKEECTQLINRGGNDEDSDEQSENEEGMGIEKMIQMKRYPLRKKGRA